MCKEKKMKRKKKDFKYLGFDPKGSYEPEFRAIKQVEQHQMMIMSYDQFIPNEHW